MSLQVMRFSFFIKKKKLHCSCEIEDFVETHFCKLCDTLIARITGCFVLVMDIGRRLLGNTV